MNIYKVQFMNHGKIYEVYAKAVRPSELLGFVELADLVFDEGQSLLVDPAEEKLKSEFAGVKRSLVPIHSVVRIDEVTKQGPGKIHELEAGSNIAMFPGTYSLPKKGGS